MKITKHTTPAEAWAAFVGDKHPKEMLAGSRFPDAVAEGYVFGCPLAEGMTDAQRRRLAALLEQHMMPHVAGKPGPKPNGWVKVCLKLSPEAAAVLSGVDAGSKSAFVDEAIKAFQSRAVVAANV